MRRILPAVAVATALLALPASTVAARAERVYLPGCNAGAPNQYKPKQIIVFCADSSEVLEKLKWQDWNGTKAHARGTASINDCEPNCAGGTFHDYPVKVTLFRPKSCTSGKLWSRMDITFTGALPTPGTHRRDRYPFPCPK
jgi:hypothetical protein